MEAEREFLTLRRAEELAAAVCAPSREARDLHRAAARIFTECLEQLEKDNERSG